MKEFDLKYGQVLVVGDTKIRLSRIIMGERPQAKLVLDAPRSVKILREELLKERRR